MKIDTTHYMVKTDTVVDLSKWPTHVDKLYRSKKHCLKNIAKQIAALSQLQQVLFAANTHAVLLVFQAMDAAGKDGAIKHVMSGVNPQGCQVFSYKEPNAHELQHDFLWRTTRDLPERGRIGIFNRSYYEEVLVARVHPEILQSEGFSQEHNNASQIWQDRYQSIVNLEQHLVRNHTRIIKIFLHIDKEEQKNRLLDRLNDPEKNWKFGISDIAERQYWSEYMHAYEKCMTATNADEAPWYIVPADDKLNARLIIAQILVENLQSLNLAYPKMSAKRQQELRKIKKQLI